MEGWLKGFCVGWKIEWKQRNGEGFTFFYAVWLGRTGATEWVVLLGEERLLLFLLGYKNCSYSINNSVTPLV